MSKSNKWLIHVHNETGDKKWMFLSWHIQLHTLTKLRLLARICKHTNQSLHIATQEHKTVSAVVSKSNDEQIIDPHLIFKLSNSIESPAFLQIC